MRRGRTRPRRRKLSSDASAAQTWTRQRSLVDTLTNHGLTPGLAKDLTTNDPDDGKPWDFDVKDKREKALRLQREQNPLFIIGSPMCTRWCSWQHISDKIRDPNIVEREKKKALVHLEFMTGMYRGQIEGGRFFLHEHPEAAGSWEERCIADILQIPEVGRVCGDQRQYGQEVQYGEHRGQPVRKATGFMSNAPKILERLTRRCADRNGMCSRSKGGKHVHASGRVAKDAARYSDGLCRAMIRGMVDEMRSRGIWHPGEEGMHAVSDEDGADAPSPVGRNGKYRDDMSGQLLRDSLVHEARAKERKYFVDKGVWTNRPKNEARQKTGKGAISVRWVDVNKGDDLCPRYRSRLVARQLKAHDKSGASFFAPTPPLEALRTIPSLAATSVGVWKPCYEKKSETRTCPLYTSDAADDPPCGILHCPPHLAQTRTH